MPGFDIRHHSHPSNNPFTADTIPADRVVVIDSGAESGADRYTAVIDGDYESALFMDADPSHPLGFGQHGEISPLWFEEEIEAGHTMDLADVPAGTRRMIAGDLNIIERERRAQLLL